MFCSKCGAKNNANSKFCMSCGNTLQKANTTNNSQPVMNNNVQPTNKLGQSPDFYTYLSAALIALTLLLWAIKPGIGVISGLFSVIAALMGRKHTTNRSLHTMILIIALVLTFAVFVGMINSYNSL